MAVPLALIPVSALIGFLSALTGGAFKLFNDKRQRVADTQRQKSDLEAQERKNVADAEAQERKNQADIEAQKRQIFFDKIFTQWDILTAQVETLRDENNVQATKIVRLESAEIRLTEQVGALKDRNLTLQTTVENERKLFERQRKSWAEWAGKILALVREAGVQIPDELAAPPLE